MSGRRHIARGALVFGAGIRAFATVLGLTEPLSPAKLARRLRAGPSDLPSLCRLLARQARPLAPSTGRAREP